MSHFSKAIARFSSSCTPIKMPLIDSYVIWNNKGGVGKTTLTFHLATQYAICNPSRRVLVIDLCPQANVSMALLNSTVSFSKKKTPFSKKKTVSFYLQKVTKPLSKVDPQKYLTHVRAYNKEIPKNVKLLCGDMHLELVSRSLEHKRQEEPDPDYNPWVFITSCIRYFIDGYGDMKGVTDGDTEWVIFIDTNPSFSPYTEIALVAAEKLIIPINADDFSREAVKAMFDLVYDISGDIPAEFKDYRRRMFCQKAKKYNVRRPKIHLLINNRSTRYCLRSAKAFKDMAASNIAVLFEVYRNHKYCFVPRVEHIRKGDFESFKKQYFEDMQDFHTTGILSLHTGCPLAYLHGKVHLFDTDVEVKRKQVDNYLVALQRLVAKLEAV